MQHKTSFLAGVLLMALLLVLPQAARCEEQTPIEFIKEFYTWYISTDGGSQKAIRSDEIYTYVEKNTVDAVREISYLYGTDRRDYFLRLSNGPLSMDGVSFTVKSSSELGYRTFILLVTIIEKKHGQTVKNDPVVVVVRKTDGQLKIVKCIDTYPEA